MDSSVGGDILRCRCGRPFFGVGVPVCGFGHDHLDIWRVNES